MFCACGSTDTFGVFGGHEGSVNFGKKFPKLRGLFAALDGMRIARLTFAVGARALLVSSGTKLICRGAPPKIGLIPVWAVATLAIANASTTREKRMAASFPSLGGGQHSVIATVVNA